MIDAESIMYLLAASVVMLIFKIVWDWLQIRKSGALVSGTVQPCKDDDMCHSVAGIREQQIRMEEREKITKQQLKDGREKFTVMQDDITEIKENVAAIAAVVNDRAKSNSPLLQGQ